MKKLENVDVTLKESVCETCGEKCYGIRRKKFCSNKCKQKDKREREKEQKLTLEKSVADTSKQLRKEKKRADDTDKELTTLQNSVADTKKRLKESYNKWLENERKERPELIGNYWGWFESLTEFDKLVEERRSKVERLEYLKSIGEFREPVCRAVIEHKERVKELDKKINELSK